MACARSRTLSARDDALSKASRGFTCERSSALVSRVRLTFPCSFGSGLRVLPLASENKQVQARAARLTSCMPVTNYHSSHPQVRREAARIGRPYSPSFVLPRPRTRRAAQYEHTKYG